MAIVIERVSAGIDANAMTGYGAFTGTPTAGNQIIVPGWTYWPSGATSANMSVTDDATGGSNTYVQDKQQQDVSGESNAAAICRAPIVNTKSGLTIGIYWGGTSYVNGIGLEVSGLDANPVDAAVSLNSAAGPPWTLATGTLAQADELIVASFCFDATTLSTHDLVANAWSGLTPTTHFTVDGTSIVAEYGVAASLIVSSTSSITTSFSANNGGTGAQIVAVSYKGAAVPAGGPHVRNFSPDAMGMRTTLRM